MLKFSGKNINTNVQFQAPVVYHIGIVVKRHEPGGVVEQENANQYQEGNFGVDIYEEGEEEEVLAQCRAEAARGGDLSLMHNGKTKKSHTRKKSWEGNMNEAVNTRLPPMRVAKQKVAAPTTLTRFNQSKKK